MRHRYRAASIDRQCRRMNRRYLGHDYVTDVISFPLETVAACWKGKCT